MYWVFMDLQHKNLQTNFNCVLQFRIYQKDITSTKLVFPMVINFYTYVLKDTTKHKQKSIHTVVIEELRLT